MTAILFTALDGRLVRLRQLQNADIEPLTSIAFAAPHEYRLTSTPADTAQAEAYFAKAFGDMAAGTAVVVTVLEAGSGRVLGSSRLTDIDRQNRRCELGYTWYRPEVFNSGVNIECKRLLLAYAFDALELLRVQINTDTRNLRSQRAIRGLGARYEGILRRHRVTKDGFVRDTMVFAVTDEDWPYVRATLDDRLQRRIAAGLHD